MQLSPQKKLIIQNTLSLSVLNGINMLLPLITLPYLIKTIGIANYGSYSIVYAMVQYVILFSTYGFNYSATKSIAENRDNIEKIAAIFNGVILSRIIIALLSVVIFSLICLLFFSGSYFIMFLFGLGMVIGDIMNPTWLFQGMEDMRYMTVINVISKSIFTIFIFIFIRSEDDYLVVTLINSIGYIVAGICSLIFAKKFFKIIFAIPSINEIKSQFKDGWFLFLSTISMSLYRESNIFILGFFESPAMVGIYSGAEKVIKAIQSLINPISNALFPYVSKSYKSISIGGKLDLIKNISKKLGILFLLIVISVVFFAPLANKLLLDNINNIATEMIRIMSPVIFLGGLNYILGIVGLVNMNQQKAFCFFVVISGVGSIIFLLLAVRIIGIYSAAYSMILSELVLFILCIYKMNHIKITCHDRNNYS